MKGHREAPENPEPLIIEETQRIRLQSLLREKIVSINRESSISMGLFFNNILIIALPGNGFEEKFVQKWNDWVNRWKSVCIDRVRGNAVRSPKIHSERVDEFFRGLIHLGLLGNVDEQVANVEEKADAILTENKKPPIS